MINETVNTQEGLVAERNELLAEIARKRTGRDVMIASGMTVEPEEGDFEMQGLIGRLAEIDSELGNDPTQARLDVL